MTAEQINDWRYPPVPLALQEALKNHPELIAEVESWLRNPKIEHGTYGSFSMSDSLDLGSRVDRLHWVTESLKDGLLYLSTRISSKVDAAKASGDAAAIAAAQAERAAVSMAWSVDLEAWKEFIDFYGLERLGDDRGMRIKEGA
ncbi:MAG: hypothetical protein ACRCV6_02515 [Formosimonas sp.]